MVEGEIMKKIFLISFFYTFLDQIIKLIVSNQLYLNESIAIINNFFNLTYVRNYGAAFSIFSGSRLFLIIIALIAIACIYNFFIKNQKLNTIEIISYSLLLGGIIGNLIDRVFLGYVIDYLDFTIFKYSFPIFNLADIFIVSSVILIVIDVVRSELNENRS